MAAFMLSKQNLAVNAEDWYFHLVYIFILSVYIFMFAFLYILNKIKSENKEINSMYTVVRIRIELDLLVTMHYTNVYNFLRKLE